MSANKSPSAPKIED
jgi:hypothetical protein